MKGWDELGVVDTIYEEEQEEEGEDDEEEDDDEKQGEDHESRSLSLAPSITTSPASPRSSTSLLSPPPSLDSRVQQRSEMTGHLPDAVVRLRDRCFNLHKDALASRSRYLRRELTESARVSLDPPPGITADTFAEVAAFCYDSQINLTPANLAAVRVAADWLEMDPDGCGGDDGGGSLTWRTEIYFRQEVAGDSVNAGHVLRGCAGLLPDVTAALLAARCVEVLAGEGFDGGWTEELTALPVEAFRAVAESMRTWFAHDHDLLYRIVDRYLEAHSAPETTSKQQRLQPPRGQQQQTLLSEEEKLRLCHTINCAKLSNAVLLHLVQNPRLPLRFILQAMLLDQLLHTRHTFLHHHHQPHPTANKPHSPSHSHSHSTAANGLTLGAVIQRDAAVRQASHLRASMEATSFRIESLERDLEGLRRKLRWSVDKRAEMESVRSSSFRMARRPEAAVSGSGRSCKGDGSVGGGSGGALVKSGKGIGRKLVEGLKSVFTKSSPGPAAAPRVEGGGERRRHRRTNSFA